MPEILKNKNIIKKSVTFYKMGKLHRIVGPAKTKFYDNGNVKCEYYVINGLLNRDNEPAYIYYNKNGEIETQMYFKNGKIHRENGPAIIYYLGKNIVQEEYFINGIMIL